jgi:basic amino acid/polyamine antiporter, APA family
MQKPQGSLLPTLGLFTTVSLVVGGMIGSGIFRNPSSMAEMLASPELLLAVWVVAGIVTLFGALTNAEVAGMIPITGGQYQYFRAMYGNFTAYMYGWALFIVIQSGSIAGITYVFAEYFNALFPLWRLDDTIARAWAIHLPFATIYPLQNLGVKLLTFAAVAGLTMINVVGVRQGGKLQVFFTVAKVGAILFLVVAAFGFGSGSLANLTLHSPTKAVPVGGALVLAMVMAMNKALWSYDGWNNITYVAGEVRQPQRTIPQALVIGTLVCIAVYVLINLAYLYILPIDSLRNSASVAATVSEIVFGAPGVTFVSVAVMIATIGTSNGTILASARVYYAMARESMFFSQAGHISANSNTPSVALWMQLGWTTLLIFTGTFDMLTDMLIFVTWAFYGMGAIGVFVLRKKMPDAPRPYRVWGYPLVPIVFIVFAALFLVFTIVSDITNYRNGTAPVINSLWGTLLLLSGIPFYWYFKTSAPKKSSQAVLSVHSQQHPQD